MSAIKCPVCNDTITVYRDAFGHGGGRNCPACNNVGYVVIKKATKEDLKGILSDSEIEQRFRRAT